MDNKYNFGDYVVINSNHESYSRYDCEDVMDGFDICRIFMVQCYEESITRYAGFGLLPVGESTHNTKLKDNCASFDEEAVVKLFKMEDMLEYLKGIKNG